MVEGRLAHRVVDNVNTPAVGQPERFLGEVALRIEDHGVGPCLARQAGLLLRRDGSDNRGADPGRHLDEQKTYPSGRRVDQGRLAPGEGVGRAGEVVGGHALEHSGRPGFGVQALRQAYELPGGHDGSLSV